MSMKKTALVVSAHAADFVWRCGGAIAAHAELGYDVTVLCLSFGERGESAKLWKQPGMTLQAVKDARRGEAEEAAKALGVHDLVCLDLGDYPLELSRDDKNQVVDVIRKVQPAFMLSHSKYDPYNTDHSYTTQVALECRMIAQAWGHNPGEKVLGAPQLYLFEPHQTEQMPQQGALTRARPPHDHANLARHDAKIDAMQNPAPTVVGLKAMDIDDRPGCGSSRAVIGDW